jgi:hypothetical protein
MNIYQRLDRRAAVFQVFKAARASGMNKWQAYNYAQAIVKPEPEDFQTRNLRDATQRHQLYNNRGLGVNWHYCYSECRYYSRPE